MKDSLLDCSNQYFGIIAKPIAHSPHCQCSPSKVNVQLGPGILCPLEAENWLYTLSSIGKQRTLFFCSRIWRFNREPQGEKKRQQNDIPVVGPSQVPDNSNTVFLAMCFNRRDYARWESVEKRCCSCWGRRILLVRGQETQMFGVCCNLRFVGNF